MKLRLFIVGIFVHVVFLVSIFDVYFKSPIVHGIKSVSSKYEAPAKRLVLFVADGLRADTFYYRDDHNRSLAPYLRYITETEGSHGYSHTRVPTESRPGHVALIAGFYEDPSAVAKGWKENPVEFDSVFNQSRFTWSWGSPDILTMFAKGASGNHVFTYTYSSELEDFSGKNNTSILDTWVFSKVEDFFSAASNDTATYSKLHSDKIIFFLHLLGLDTAGHTYKPHSREYLQNLVTVDKGIRKIVTCINDFYLDDKRTAFIFTSDHGMTDWGSHGAGEHSETETPIVAWGAGINGPEISPDVLSGIPTVSKYRRKNVTQADVAPLMSVLLGIPIPVNSVGTVPNEYLNMKEETIAEVMFQNALQMLAHYDRKRELVEKSTISFLYFPFLPLTASRQLGLKSEIQAAIDTKDFVKAVQKCHQLISLSLEGLEYYHNYYQLPLLVCITLSFVGWTVLLFRMLIIPSSTSMEHSKWFPSLVADKDYALHFFFFTFVIATAVLLFVQSLPLQFYVYCILPEILWWMIAHYRHDYYNAYRCLTAKSRHLHFILLCILALVGVELLVMSFFHRTVLTFGMCGFSIWPFTAKLSIPRKIKFMWIFSCVFLAVFPTLPVIGKDSNIRLVTFSGILWLIFFCVYALWVKNVKRQEYRDLVAMIFHWIFVLTTVYVYYNTTNNLNNKKGLPLVNQMFSWSAIGVALFLPQTWGTLWIPTRLISIFTVLCVNLLLLSSSHEVLFLFALSLNLLSWLAVEQYITPKPTKFSELNFSWNAEEHIVERSVTTDDFRRSYFFLFYIILSFFGTGNIASINSFDVMWVRCFVTVFSPFIMTALILWKTVIPFLVVTCTFRALNIVVKAPVGKLFLIVLILCNIMALHFLYLVTNKGSWLDIGTSISHYVIMQVTILFLTILYGFASYLTGYSFVPACREPSSHLPVFVDTTNKDSRSSLSSATNTDMSKEHTE